MKLIVKDISKKIDGAVILEHISFTAESGKIYGVLGRNGSGKTMLFRLLSGLMQIDSGSIELDEKKLGTDFGVLPNLGLTLEHAGMFPNLSAYENLKYLADIKGKIGKKEIYEAMERVGLDPKDSKKYGKYSVGMKQRVAIAQAIMEKPDIIMLDEPTSGLDTEGVMLIRNILKEERDRGALILLASHIKEDIDLLADCVFTIERGRKISE